MSAADAEAFVADVRKAHPMFTVGAVIIFVDYREDNRQRKKKEGDTRQTLLEALNSVHVRGSVGVPVRCTLKAGDAIVARVVPANHFTSDSAEANAARRRAIVENIGIDGASCYDMLEDLHAVEFDCIMTYERKTLEDLISSTKARGSAGREQHLDEQIGRMLVFCQATGAQPRLVLEGYAQEELAGTKTGVQVLDHAHSGLTHIACIDGVAPWHSDSTVGTARLLLKDARECREQNLESRGWTRMGTLRDTITPF